MQLSQTQLDRIIYLFETPTSELSSEKMFETLNSEFNVEIPAEAWKMFIESYFGKSMSARPRKVRPEKTEPKPKVEKPTQFTFYVPNGEIVADLKAKVVDKIDYEPMVVTNKEEEVQQEVVGAEFAQEIPFAEVEESVKSSSYNSEEELF